ncbi:leucine-rich repeat protein [bacterium]|nr:leucine-rich repeat protein [bacterium]
MRKKYINLLILGSCISITSIVAANIALFSQKNNSTSINNAIINKINNNSKYYHTDGFLLSIPSQYVTINNITYSLNNSQNTATVINVKNNLGTLIIPSTIENNGNYYNITAIGNGACYSKQITKLILSNNIVSIGADAFANNLLTNITLPPYLTSLGNNAFSNNPFSPGTVVNLPSNCSWNKTASLAPFNNNDNMGNFARCVKYIIQNLAVYGYVYGANA